MAKIPQLKMKMFFRSYPAPAAPPAMWSAMIVWSSSGSVCVYVVKMDRQTVDSKEFRPDQER